MRRIYRAGWSLLLLAGLLLPGCIAAPVDCSQPEVFCVGLVTEVGGKVDDRSYNQAAWEGVQRAKANGVADQVASIETVDSRDYEENIRIFTEGGYDVIVTIGSGMSDVTRAAAQASPATYFVGLDQDQSGNQSYTPNLAGLIFPEDQIGYLAGALAALLSQTGQIGAVCGSEVSPAMQRYGGGFRAGAAQVNPDAEVTVIYHSEVGLDRTFDDPEWGAVTANSLVDNGVDIIFGVGGSTGNNALVAAVARGAYGIGADIDQYYALPVAAPHLYASALKLISPAITELITSAKDAQARTSVFLSGNYMGQVDLSSYHDLSSSVPGEVKSRMAELVQALRSGEIQTGVLVSP